MIPTFVFDAVLSGVTTVAYSAGLPEFIVTFVLPRRIIWFTEWNALKWPKDDWMDPS
jgi:hypothetical protein